MTPLINLRRDTSEIECLSTLIFVSIIFTSYTPVNGSRGKGDRRHVFALAVPAAQPVYKIPLPLYIAM
ncbi:uncharacterized protein N7500_006775 [Penicillium coprophilum]|uniref:uncharacterized protein n=1 Tax=Penicillium coprophilum TaxID=36646 RepID=UPI0023951952|nr:uncharacterized protein N7500_006775 [Penicillium coprophilum]KAJ5164945.1 hypothetical protein N7500_006775 [Penicillium coprophilum]